MHGRAQLKHLPARQVGIKYRLVREKSDKPFDLYAFLKCVPAVDGQVSLGGLKDSHQEPEKSGFSGAVGTQQPADLSGWNRKGDIFKSDLRTECLGDSINLHQSRRWLSVIGGSRRLEIRAAHLNYKS